MDEQQQYHPKVEEVMETSGLNIGRVRDEEIARNVAEKVNSVHDRNQAAKPSQSRREINVDEAIKYEIAKRTVVDSALTDTITKSGTGWMTGVGNEDLASLGKDALVDARKAAVSYNELQKVSKPANLENENKMLHQRLKEARDKINET